MSLSCFSFVPHWQVIYISCDVTAISLNIAFLYMFLYMFFYNFIWLTRIDVPAFSSFLSCRLFAMSFSRCFLQCLSLAVLLKRHILRGFFLVALLHGCSCNVFCSYFVLASSLRLYCCSGVLFDIIVLHLLGYCCNVFISMNGCSDNVFIVSFLNRCSFICFLFNKYLIFIAHSCCCFK